MINPRVSHAQIIGRSHLLSGRNSQDALSVGSLEIDGKNIFYGVICDGCSEGTDSEVGAKLAVSYLGRQIEILVKSKVPVQKIPIILHKRMLDFLKKVLGRISFESPESRINYIKNNFLFTIVAFICAEETTIFAQGDGVIIVNGEVIVRDEQNKPSYIGYELVDRKFLSPEAHVLPQSFDVNIYPTESISKLAIASDSLGNELEVVPSLWGNDKPISLQKKVNVWSLVEHKFSDDLSIIILESSD